MSSDTPAPPAESNVTELYAIPTFLPDVEKLIGVLNRLLSLLRGILPGYS
jgi:hypothetical protein